MYSYVVCERRYQESNSPMIPLQKVVKMSLVPTLA